MQIENRNKFTDKILKIIKSNRKMVLQNKVPSLQKIK